MADISIRSTTVCAAAMLQPQVESWRAACTRVAIPGLGSGFRSELQPFGRALRLVLQKIADDRAEAIHVDQERVVPLERRQARELHFATADSEPVRQLLLLLDRKQQIRLDADDQRSL